MSNSGPGGSNNSNLNNDDQAFLNEIEQNLRDNKDIQTSQKKEIDQRSNEMDRLRETLEKNPNFGQRKFLKKQSPTVPIKSAPLSETQRMTSISDDPRYREYYERLRKDKNRISGTPIAAPTHEHEPKKQSGVFAKAHLKNGDIIAFSDGSVGIARNPSYEDSTTMFYFLWDDGTINPIEIFLKYYSFQKVGTLPEYLFAEQRNDGKWNRDMIVFHLGDYEYVRLLNELKPHTKLTSDKAVESEPTKPTSPHETESAAQESDDSSPALTSPSAHDLARGQKIRINFSGKAWEAVYWDGGEHEAVLAHQTHGNWALMRLDLDRFTESLELLNILNADKITEIEAALTDQNT